MNSDTDSPLMAAARCTFASSSGSSLRLLMTRLYHILFDVYYIRVPGKGFAIARQGIGAESRGPSGAAEMRIAPKPGSRLAAALVDR